MGVEGGVEVRHDIAPEVEGAAHLPVLHALHGGGDAPEDTEPVTGQGVAPALQVGQLQAEGPGQVIVHQGRGGRLQAGGHQHGKRPALATQNKFAFITVVILGCEAPVVVVS